jgi:hypothetical protein
VFPPSACFGVYHISNHCAATALILMDDPAAHAFTNLGRQRGGCLVVEAL